MLSPADGLYIHMPHLGRLSRWAGYATSVLASLQIQVLSFVYSHVVRRLNDFENYRTETAYDNNLIFKTFLFQVRRVF